MVDVSFEKIMSSSVIYQELIDYNLWVNEYLERHFLGQTMHLAAISNLGQNMDRN